MTTALEIEEAVDAAFEKMLPGSMKKIRPGASGQWVKWLDPETAVDWDSFPLPRDRAAAIMHLEENRP